jgi:hypothetical protein
LASSLLLGGCGATDGQAAVEQELVMKQDMTVPPALATPPPAKRLKVSNADILDPTQGNSNLGMTGWNWGQWGQAVEQDAVDNSTAPQNARVVRILLRWWGEYGQPADAIDSYDSNPNSTTGFIKASGLATLKQNIQWAQAHNLWIILGIDSNCGQAAAIEANSSYCLSTATVGAGNSFANNQKMLDRFKAAWTYLISLYGNSPYIAMYEALPEPNYGCATVNGKITCDWSTAQGSAITATNKVLGQLYTTLSTADSRTPILIGASDTYDIDHIATVFQPTYQNVIYTADILNGAAIREYNAEKGTPPTTTLQPLFDMQSGVATQAANGGVKKPVPVYVQQVGVQQDSKNLPTDAATVAKTVLSKLNNNNIGWAWWTYRESSSANSPCGGVGYAPWCEHTNYKAQPGYVEDTSWLSVIYSKFKHVQ